MLYYQDINTWKLTKTLTINHLSGIDGRVRWKTPNLCANIFNVCMQEDILVCTSEGLMNNWICTLKNPLHEKNMYLQFSSNKSITLYYLLISTLHSLNRAGGRSENLGGAISIAMPFDGLCFVQSFPRVCQNLKTKKHNG